MRWRSLLGDIPGVDTRRTPGTQVSVPVDKAVRGLTQPQRWVDNRILGPRVGSLNSDGIAVSIGLFRYEWTGGGSWERRQDGQDYLDRRRKFKSVDFNGCCNKESRSKTAKDIPSILTCHRLKSRVGKPLLAHIEDEAEQRDCDADSIALALHELECFLGKSCVCTPKSGLCQAPFALTTSPRHWRLHRHSPF